MNFPEDVPVLTDGVVTLRAHRESDAQGSFEQCQDPLSQQWTTVPVPYVYDEATAYVSKIIPSGWETDSEWAFAIEAADGDGNLRYGGTISLRNEGDRRAEIAYGSHPWVRGGGLMLRALNLLLDWGYEAKRLETVIWWANKGNWASRKLAWRLGFSFDGTVRQWLPQRGDLLDAWVGALLSTDDRTPKGTWLDIPRVVGEKVVLRSFEARDAPRIQQACSEERTAHWLAQMPQPYTLDHAEAYIAGRTDALARGDGVYWAVADPETDELIGNVGLMEITPGDDAEVGYWTHPDARGRGVMTEACGLAVRHAFIPIQDGGLGLRRLTVLAVEGNVASHHVIKANGFVETGRHRKEAKLGDGTWADMVTYDLLLEEYR